MLSANDSDGDYFYAGMSQITGEIYLAYGANDQPAGFLAYGLGFMAVNVDMIHIKEIPDCDHGFRGDTNNMILSKAYGWAFAGDATFPSPEGGILLYQE